MLVLMICWSLTERSYAGRFHHCSHGYESCGDYCYQRLHRKESYQDAKRACSRRHGWLVVPRSDEEYHCARDLARGSTVWMGIQDLHNDGRGNIGIDGREVSKHSHYWAHGEPNRKNHRCVVLVPHEGWKDRSCRDHYYPLCRQH